MSSPFVVFGLPRSRTAWLSSFLTHGEWTCGHDEVRHARSLDDVRSWLAQHCTGTVETAAAPWWRTLRRIAPGARVAVLRRPVSEVVESLLRLDMGFERDAMTAAMTRLDRKLDQIAARWPGAMQVQFAGLQSEATCAAVFRHCLGYEPPPGWWARWQGVNVQVNMRAVLRYCHAFAPQMSKLAGIARHQTLAAMQVRPPVEPAGMTFQADAFDDWERDGAALFRAHCVAVGEEPDSWLRKNIPLMRKLHELGCMQVMTARCNGRMFGYLMTVMGPSLEDAGLTSSMHGLFYASPDVPGLGLKLQRAALAALKARGVGEVAMRAGVRGSGPKMDVLYRRLGAEDFGQMFRLNLMEA